jgi:hypothetical protein
MVLPGLGELLWSCAVLCEFSGRVLRMDPSASESGGSGKDTLEEMMLKLRLKEEDLDDIVFEDESPPPAEATRWLAIARVHTEREFSDFWFYKNMRTAWDLAQEVKFRSLEDNMFTMNLRNK